MEGRRIFAELTVDENLRAGAYSRRDRGGVKSSYDRVLDLFPVLGGAPRGDRPATSPAASSRCSRSARALMADPKLLLLDEPSLGLAPLIVQQIREIIVEINRQGTSVLLVEQNATHGAVHRRPRLRPRERPGREGRAAAGAHWPTPTSRSSTSASARPGDARSVT